MKKRICKLGILFCIIISLGLLAACGGEEAAAPAQNQEDSNTSDTLNSLADAANNSADADPNQNAEDPATTSPNAGTAPIRESAPEEAAPEETAPDPESAPAETAPLPESAPDTEGSPLPEDMISFLIGNWDNSQVSLSLVINSGDNVIVHDKFQGKEARISYSDATGQYTLHHNNHNYVGNFDINGNLVFEGIDGVFTRVTTPTYIKPSAPTAPSTNNNHDPIYNPGYSYYYYPYYYPYYYSYYYPYYSYYYPSYYYY